MLYPALCCLFILFHSHAFQKGWIALTTESLKRDFQWQYNSENLITFISGTYIYQTLGSRTTVVCSIMFFPALSQSWSNHKSGSDLLCLVWGLFGVFFQDGVSVVMLNIQLYICTHTKCSSETLAVVNPRQEILSNREVPEDWMNADTYVCFLEDQIGLLG